MREIFIQRTKELYDSDAFNNSQYAYLFRYNGPDSHGYMAIMTKEGYMMLELVLKLFCKVTYSEC